MKTAFNVLIIYFLCCGIGLFSSCEQQKEKNVLLIVGGHDFDEEPFYAMMNTKHPVTKGISDFQIVDEAYGGTEILESVHPLLATDEPASAPLVGWTNFYAKAKVVTLTLGHDKQAWENPVFSQIVSQAVSWVGDR
jgi:type 1 glutamine amidotransferase